jgi:hypothetical protein
VCVSHAQISHFPCPYVMERMRDGGSGSEVFGSAFVPWVEERNSQPDTVEFKQLLHSSHGSSDSQTQPAGPGIQAGWSPALACRAGRTCSVRVVRVSGTGAAARLLSPSPPTHRGDTADLTALLGHIQIFTVCPPRTDATDGHPVSPTLEIRLSLL